MELGNMADLTAEEQDYFDEHQEDICDYCEANIIEGSSMSIHYMCEGSHCVEACQKFKDDAEPEEDSVGVEPIIDNTERIAMMKSIMQDFTKL